MTLPPSKAAYRAYVKALSIQKQRMAAAKLIGAKRTFQYLEAVHESYKLSMYSIVHKAQDAGQDPNQLYLISKGHISTKTEIMVYDHLSELYRPDGEWWSFNQMYNRWYKKLPLTKANRTIHVFGTVCHRLSKLNLMEESVGLGYYRLTHKAVRLLKTQGKIK